MKKIRKLAGLMLALVIALAMSVTALATQTDTYTITINNTTSGHTYEAYQIFDGDLSEDGTVLSNIVWGSGVDTSKTVNNLTLLQAIQAIADTSDTPTTYPFASCSTAQNVADVLKSYNDDSAVLQEFASVVGKYLSNTCATSTEVTTGTAPDVTTVNYTISNLSAGYYLVKDQDDSLDDEDDAYTRYILKVVTNVSVNPKDTTTPDFDKTVDSGTTDVTVDYAVGDAVPFTLTATLPSSYSAYDTYKLVFNDTLSDGLTFNSSSVVVKVVDASDTEVKTLVYDDNTKEYTLESSTDQSSGETTVTITITDLKSITGLESVTTGYKVIVTYTATLNNSAENVESNEAYLEYSNNPNGDSTGKTEKDKTYVVTFELDVTKTDGGGNPLEGAQFTLYKYLGTGASGADSEGYATEGTLITASYQYVALSALDEFESDVTYYTYDAGTGDYTQVADTSGTPDPSTTYYVYVANKFTVDGLAVGQYKLVETTTPDGYNTIDPIYFTVSATTSEDESTGIVTDYTVTVTKGTGTFSADDDNKVVSTTIQNNSGANMPSTGGIGTTIFYIVGSALILLAVVLLITRSRMRKHEEE